MLVEAVAEAAWNGQARNGSTRGLVALRQPQRRAMTQKTQIAILGGGIGALTAAFELVEQDLKEKELRQKDLEDRKESRHDITVYTLGWRLGGKALVGRDKHAGWRALEHGLHVWTGFYDNAFDLVQRLYARLGVRQTNGAEIRRAEPLHSNGIRRQSMEALAAARPPNALDPGIDQTGDLAPLALLRQLLSWAEQSFVNSALAEYQTPIAQARCNNRSRQSCQRVETMAFQHRSLR